ncbi:hypothetical protein RQP53_21890 [Paucibacter sp. APW11]|uniref:Uncharacterized protein n=1 Tax=Roseateles aquae TaxID=3077235 RepID=A0ABU3PH90_9BURK|nr:hypothetical protein [Paucibacter sp. APW11]MDT9001944.1 hypothetical protein [Paucibacter sp. APW11]
MTTLTLSYTGPSTQARQALGGLLQRFRTAYFVERSSHEYLVTADPATAAELAAQAQWQALPAQDTDSLSAATAGVKMRRQG